MLKFEYTCAKNHLDSMWLYDYDHLLPVTATQFVGFVYVKSLSII